MPIILRSKTEPRIFLNAACPQVMYSSKKISCIGAIQKAHTVGHFPALNKMLSFVCVAKTTHLTIVGYFFMEFCFYKELSPKHYGNALIHFFYILLKSKFFTALTIILGESLMLNFSSTFDATTIIFTFF